MGVKMVFLNIKKSTKIKINDIKKELIEFNNNSFTDDETLNHIISNFRSN